MFLKIDNHLIRLDQVSSITVFPEKISFFFGAHPDCIEVTIEEIGPERFENLRLYLNTHIDQEL
jgi:hypothetical protein